LPDSEPNELQSIARVYSLLARLWIREVDSVLLSELTVEPVESALSDLGMSPPTESLEQLSAEYCGLFIGPRDALLPMQSVWQRSQLDSSLAVSVEKFAELIDYPAPPSVLWDHLGVQLDLMSELVLAMASHPQRNGTPDTWSDVACEFFFRHLNWASPLLLATTQRATLPFYRSLAEMTQQFLTVEQVTWRTDHS